MNQINQSLFTKRLIAEMQKDIENFVKDIEDIDTTNLPEPFLPIHGNEYGLLSPKIMFCGWETRGSKNLTNWVNEYKSDIDNVIFWREDFLNHEFLKWRTNFGSDFWSFNLKLLAKFHHINNWKDLYNNPEVYRSILSSFVWANTDSIERFSVTAEMLGCNYEEWKVVKNASIRFDNFERLIKIYEPDILIIEHWDLDESWIHQNIRYSVEDDTLDEFLWYYEIADSNCKIFWLPHPRGHNKREIDANSIIEKIYNKINNSAT